MGKNNDKNNKKMVNFNKKQDFKTKQIDKQNCKKHTFVLMISGAFIGLINGFFGGGGGMICVPVLQKVLSLDDKSSHATAIAVILPLSIVSAGIYIFNGYISSMPLLAVSSGVIVGGLIGSYALKILPPKFVRVLFALIMFLGGIKLIF